jgi:hypothetical protein
LQEQQRAKFLAKKGGEKITEIRTINEDGVEEVMTLAEAEKSTSEEDDEGDDAMKDAEAAQPKDRDSEDELLRSADDADDKDAIADGDRWGIDVKVPGIRNHTGYGERKVNLDESSNDEDADEEPLGGEFVKCEHSGLNPEFPRLRHVWCMGPTWTHALEIGQSAPRPTPLLPPFSSFSMQSHPPMYCEIFFRSLVRHGTPSLLWVRGDLLLTP